MDRQRDYIRILTPTEQRMAIVREVAEQAGVAPHLVMGPSRKPNVCRARWAAMAALQERMGDKSWRIGRLFARDHTTVIHGLRRHAELTAIEAEAR